MSGSQSIVQIVTEGNVAEWEYTNAKFHGMRIQHLHGATAIVILSPTSAVMAHIPDGNHKWSTMQLTMDQTRRLYLDDKANNGFIHPDVYIIAAIKDNKIMYPQEVAFIRFWKGEHYNSPNVRILVYDVDDGMEDRWVHVSFDSLRIHCHPCPVLHYERIVYEALDGQMFTGIPKALEVNVAGMIPTPKESAGTELGKYIDSTGATYTGPFRCATSTSGLLPKYSVYQNAYKPTKVFHLPPTVFVPHGYVPIPSKSGNGYNFYALNVLTPEDKKRALALHPEI